MMQNDGELMMYIGGGLCLLYPVSVLVINLLSSVTKGRFRGTSTMGIVLGLGFLIGIVLFFVGDSYRKDISKDVMLSYYEKNIAFKDLTRAQRKNIEVSIIEIPKMKKAGEDVSKFIPALKKYMFEYYISLGFDKKRAEENVKTSIE